MERLPPSHLPTASPEGSTSPATTAGEQEPHEQEARLALALDAGQIATWDWFVPEARVVWSDQMYLLYGYEIGAVEPSYALWASHIHPDDRPAVEEMLQRSMEGEPRYVVEFRMIPAGGAAERWVEARGRFRYDEDGAPLHLTGVVSDVTERKESDAALREQARALAMLNQINTSLASELDLDELVQTATDAATELASAQFGAFFYNVHDEDGEAYTLYAVSGVPREAFEHFPMPRNTHVFGPTFRGESVVRSDDITKDPRYGQNAPYHGMPEGHLPVRSYLAVPVVSRSGEVHGGLFFGHEQPGVFTEQAEHLVAGIAAQAAVAIDNARLYEAAQRELAERKEAEAELARITAESERQRRLYEAIFSGTPDLVYVFDLGYRFTFVNDALLHMWGRTLEESVGKRLLEVGYEPWHAEMHEREIDQVVATKQPVRGEVPFPHATLGERIYEYIFVPVLDAQGDVEAVAGTTRDVTERKQAEEALRVSEAQFRVALKHAPIVVQRLDRELRYEWVYNTHQDTPRDIIGMRAGASRPPEEAEPYVDLLQEVLDTGEGKRRELTFDMPSGRVVTDLTVEPVHDEAGEIVGVLTAAYDVTEIRRVETALLESEARFRAMADSAPVLIWMAGTDALCDYFNAVWLAFTGRTMEQELGDGWVEGVHPDDVERCLDVYMSAFEAREPFEMEYRLRRHDGVYRWLLDRGTPRFAPDGTFLGFIGSCFDIHDRRQAEAHTRYLAETGTLVEQALDYEATLQQIAHLAVPGFADWCAVDLLHDDGSISAIAIAHADPEKVRWGWELREREPVDPDAPTGAPNVIRTGQSELYAHIPDELLVQSARDEEHLQLMREIGFSSVIIVPMRAGGAVAGALTFVNTSSGRHFDEADLATAEELGRRAGAAVENARLHEALRASEARFRQLAEALPDIAYTSTGEGLPDYVNARWTEYTGLAAHAASYLDDPDRVIHPDDRERVAAAWTQAKERGEPMETELRLRRHDGAYRWFLTRAVPVHDSAGRVVRWFGTSTDIHNQKAAEAELAERVAERTAELARSNEALDQFAYVASHDLKAPLRGIANLASWITEDAGPLLPEDSKRHLDLLQRRVLRMERLLSDLLAYSRAGREEGAPEEVDTAALVREVVDLLDGPSGIEVVVGEMPTLVTPRTPLEMVFRNLIGNALKHHDRSEEGRVLVRAHGTGDFVTFSVEDDGPGIPVRYHERVFGLFQTLRPRDEIEGSGMGLAIVKKAVESVGGTVRVDSAEGQGATFTFTWPRHV